MTVWQLTRRLLALLLRGRGGDEVLGVYSDDDADYEYEAYDVEPSGLRVDRFVIVRLRIGD